MKITYCVFVTGNHLVVWKKIVCGCQTQWCLYICASERTITVVVFE